MLSQTMLKTPHIAVGRLQEDAFALGGMALFG